MGRSNETWSKREKEKKRQKKKEEKLKRREQRHEENEGQSFDDMIAYVDADGNPTDTPPDPSDKEEVEADDIVIGIPKKSEMDEEEENIGMVSFFNTEKGYGFIKVKGSSESLFTHINSHIDEIKEGNKVSFDREKGEKGPVAVNVKIVK
ncbi:MAG: cold shock domain-containing protein [Flavobacteriales bacterium]|nr:cold shock domain-containing protein [Flavobacteriales bacterium]